MSRGLGRIERACLHELGFYYEAEHRHGPWREKQPPEWLLARATTLTLVCKVYKIEPDENGSRWYTDAQHSAVKRALRGLRRN
jgi:hypothetical protein